MPHNVLTLVTIVCMGLATYVTRIGGFWLVKRLPPSPRVAAWMRNIPGAVLISLIAPTAFSSGVAETLAMLVTVLVALRTKQVLVAMLAGVLAVWLLRHLL
jgi:uncharacterized membrane protein